MLAGDPLERADQLQDGGIGDSIQDGAALTAAGDDAGGPQDGQVLAHVRDLAPDVAGEVADGALATIGEILEDAQPLRVRQGPGDSGRTVALCGGGGSGDSHHVVHDIGSCANAQVIIFGWTARIATR
jgi:hypothetical protein